MIDPTTVDLDLLISNGAAMDMQSGRNTIPLLLLVTGIIGFAAVTYIVFKNIKYDKNRQAVS